MIDAFANTEFDKDHMISIFCLLPFSLIVSFGFQSFMHKIIEILLANLNRYQINTAQSRCMFQLARNQFILKKNILVLL